MWRDGQGCCQAALSVAGRLPVRAEMPLLALDPPRWSTLYSSATRRVIHTISPAESRCRLGMARHWREPLGRETRTHDKKCVAGRCAKSLLGRIDFLARINAQNVRRTSHMVAVAMRHDRKIKCRQVYVACLCVAGEDGGVVPAVKEDSFSRVLSTTAGSCLQEAGT